MTSAVQPASKSGTQRSGYSSSGQDAGREALRLVHKEPSQGVDSLSNPALFVHPTVHQAAMRLSSVLLQPNDAAAKVTQLAAVVWTASEGGAAGLSERLGGAALRVSPGAFFQATTLGAEFLYEVVGQAARGTVVEKSASLSLPAWTACSETSTI